MLATSPRTLPPSIRGGEGGACAGIGSYALQDQVCGGGAGVFVDFLDFVVGLEGFDGGFVASAGFQEEPGGDELGSGPNDLGDF